jgi:hypothetical protein
MTGLVNPITHLLSPLIPIEKRGVAVLKVPPPILIPENSLIKLPKVVK